MLQRLFLHYNSPNSFDFKLTVTIFVGVFKFLHTFEGILLSVVHLSSCHFDCHVMCPHLSASFFRHINIVGFHSLLTWNMFPDFICFPRNWVYGNPIAIFLNVEFRKDETPLLRVPQYMIESISLCKFFGQESKLFSSGASGII